MKCSYVLRQLSWFLDDVLERDEADNVSEHLEQCDRCHRELERLKRLRRKLASFERPEAPEYLRHLIQLRLGTKQETWRDLLRDTVELRWSRIRTTESIWYLTRLLGTATTFLFFLAISASMSPIYLGFNQQQGPDRTSFLLTFKEQLFKNLGLTQIEAPQKHSGHTEPRINDLYFLNFSENASRTGKDDTFSVLTVVDRSGAAKIQNVLEYPADQSLLADFNDMLTSARCRPAIQNGRAVDSRLVLSFSKISVYD
jgi:hypothetical protein